MAKKKEGPGLVTIDEWVKMHEDNVAEAARKAGSEYIPFYRYLKRKVYAPEHAATRREFAAKGIELPRRKR